MRAYRRAVAVLVCAFAMAACGIESEPRPKVERGNEDRGRIALAELGCGACHVIPGVRGAVSGVGPPLASYSRFIYLAGKFPNRPELLVQWIADPASLAPKTAMPAVPMSEQQARDMAAYLYSLD